MIAYLMGEVVSVSESSVILVASGVGYKVTVPQKTISNDKITKGSKMELYIYSHIREDAFDLYGLPSIKDLELFEKIVSISGIGPKIAIGIFNKGDTGKIINAILSSDVAFFTGIPRLGRKNAQKLIIELKTKLGGQGTDEIPNIDDESMGYVLQALKGFGFTRAESIEALKQVGEDTLSVEDRLKQALKYLGK